MGRFTATGLSAELQKTPKGWSMDFQDERTGEWWVAIRKADMESLLSRVDHAPDQEAQEPTS